MYICSVFHVGDAKTHTMKNGNTPINAVFDEFGHITGETCSETGHTDFYGLTKREYFAGLAMQGMLADPSRNLFPQQYAEMAIEVADALLAELAKPKQP